MDCLRSKKAQAVLELAIFGAILIMLLGAILNYGLRYSLQQKTMMGAFRKALAESQIKEPDRGGQASYTLMQDKHIPNPANPFGVGSTMPFISSESVIRSYRLHESADTYGELPQTTINIPTKDKPKREFPYKTAGFRAVTIGDWYEEPGEEEEEEEPAAEDVTSLNKYQEIYGESNVFRPRDENNIPLGVNLFWIIDSCEGQIINFDACKRQCHMITDADFCEKECENGKLKGSEKNCKLICRKTIETPWYCEGWNRQDGVLAQLFGFAIAQNKPKAMGLQADTQKQSRMKSSLTKGEAGRVITTTDYIDWSDNINRKIIINEHMNVETGMAEPSVNIVEVPVPTEIGETATKTYQDGVEQEPAQN